MNPFASVCDSINNSLDCICVFLFVHMTGIVCVHVHECVCVSVQKGPVTPSEVRGEVTDLDQQGRLATVK